MSFPRFTRLIAFATFALLSVSARAQFINNSFEDPAFTPGVASYDIVDESLIPGWNTTASDKKIEIWSDGFLGVSSYSGNQHAELNANEISNLYQEVSVIPSGAILGFEFAHRGRNGVDTLRLVITDLGSDNVFGNSNDTILFSQEYSTGNSAWAFYTNDYTRIVALGNNVRFSYESVSAAGGSNSIGNFLDAVNFGIGVGTPAVPEPGDYVFAGVFAIGSAGLMVKRFSAR